MIVSEEVYYSSGYEIMRNPAYLVTESFNNMATGSYARSAELFDLAANLDDNFSSAAHYNAAYAIIRGKIGNYKQTALEHLELAADGIKQVLIPNLEVLQVTATKSSDSPLTKQIIQKIELLKLQLNYIDKTKATIEGCAGKNYIEISENRLLREFFTFDKTPEAEISELNIFGIHTFYDVKEVEPPINVFGAIFMAVASVVQIGIGIACTMSGNVALGASLLIEGFQDALAAMKIANNDNFDWKNYFTAKGISAAVTVVTIGATSLMNKLSTVKTAAELGKEAAKQALIEAGKEVTEKAIKQELIKSVLKEVVKRVVVNTAIDKIANKGMGKVLDEFKDEIRQHVERNINRCIDLSVTHNQLMHLFELDDFNGNLNNYRNVTQSAVNVLKHNQSVLNNIASRVINEVASNSTMPTTVKVIGTAAKAVDVGRAMIEVQNVVDRLQDRLSSHIASLDQSSPDIAGILEQKLHPVFNSTKAKETVAILENQGFIVNGRFVKIDGIDEIDFEKYDYLKKYIVRPCKKLYEAQHKDYNHLTQKLKSDLINYVVRSMLGSIRSEIMHPVLATPLAKLSNMVTEGIAKTFAEFTDGQRLKAIEAKIAANASKQDEASRGFYGPAIGAGDEDGGFLKKLNNKLLGKDKKISPAITEEVSKLSDEKLTEERSKILIKHPNEYESAIIYEHAKRFPNKVVDDGIQAACERLPALMHGMEKITGEQVCKGITPVDVAENVAGNALTTSKLSNTLKDKPPTKQLEPSTVKKEVKVEKEIISSTTISTKPIIKLEQNASFAKEKVASNPLITRKYVREVEKITNLGIEGEQLGHLKQALQQQEFKRLDIASSLKHRKDFRSQVDKLRKEWENNTSKKWPKYESHPNPDRIGQPYDAHHLIQVDHGGPNTWWNIHPAHGIDEHPKIHGKGSIAREIFDNK